MLNETILRHLTPITDEERALLAGDDIDRTLYMNGPHDVVSGEKLLDSGRLITVRPHTRFVHFPEHTHDYVEMVYMCRGSTTHIIGGQTVLLREGELLLLGQHTRQEILRAEETDIAVNFIIRPEFFSDTLPYLGNEETPLRRFLVDSLCGGCDAGYLYFQVADVLPVQNLVENLLWLLLSDTPHKRGIDRMTMGLLFLQLTNHTDRLHTHSPEQEAVLRALRYMEDNYRNGSLTEAAALVHYDIAWLSREIKRYTGRTYTELMQKKRLSQAAWMLHNTDERVADIAVAVGYENASYFHRLFAAHFGCSPKQYRDGK